MNGDLMSTDPNAPMSPHAIPKQGLGVPWVPEKRILYCVILVVSTGVALQWTALKTTEFHSVHVCQ